MIDRGAKGSDWARSTKPWRSTRAVAKNAALAGTIARDGVP
jgi:hypothetical protein